MAENISALNNLTGVNGTPDKPKKKNSEVGKDEFLQLLVTQLKNQDPMDPMKGEEFAVNLAQFSQLEQLISINQKMGSSASGGDISSMAAYLGKEVSLNSKNIEFTNGDGGIVKFDLMQDATEVNINLLNEDGSIRNTIELGAMESGKQAVAVTGDASESGSYGFQITAKGTDGRPFEPRGSVGAIIDGFVPGDTPLLLAGGREIDPSEIVSVGLPRG